MTLAEKVGQLHQPQNVASGEHTETLRNGAVGSTVLASGATAGNVADDGVAVRALNQAQRIAVEESRLGIPVLFARDVIHGHRTVLPISLGQAATWDENLVEQGARMAASEASAVGIGWTFAPMMDITGDHRWGRVAESLGEDPVLSGRLPAAMVQGFQTDDLSAPDAIAACGKHCVGYGLAEGGRDYNTVATGENTLRNLQLRPFRAAVQAGVATVMAAFNDLDGVPMHGNRRYLREILKDEWDWDGVVLSDWDGIGELVAHRVAPDLHDAAAQGVQAGVDIDMVSRAYTDHLAHLVHDGTVPFDLVDEAVRRVLRLKFRCGLFEHPYTDESLEREVAGPEQRAIARHTAAASMVLLTNNGILPLKPTALGRVLMTGPMYDATAPLFGTWTLDGREDEVVTVAAGMAGRFPVPAPTSSGAETAPAGSVPWNHADEVLAQARVADTVIVFIGEHPCRSGEANSTSALDLPPGQLETLQAIGRWASGSSSWCSPAARWPSTGWSTTLTRSSGPGTLGARAATPWPTCSSATSPPRQAARHVPAIRRAAPHGLQRPLHRTADPQRRGSPTRPLPGQPELAAVPVRPRTDLRPREVLPGPGGGINGVGDPPQRRRPGVHRGCAVLHP